MKHSHRIAVLCIATGLFVTAATAQTPADNGSIIPLYPKGTIASPGVPETREQRDGETLIFNVSEPTLELFRPEPGRANGTAVIVAPGGGFVGLGYEAGGTAIARALAQRGVTAFVLKYRTIRSAADPMKLPEVHMKEMEDIMARAKSGVPPTHRLPSSPRRRMTSSSRTMPRCSTLPGAACPQSRPLDPRRHS